MRQHRLLKDISLELNKYIKDYDVCQMVGALYLKYREKLSEEESRKYHHDCLKNLTNNLPSNISWSYYIPFTQIKNDDVNTREVLYAHLHKKDELSVYLKILASRIGIRVLGDVVCGAIGIDYFKNNLNLRDKIKEINGMKYHMLISCYNNINYELLS